jgi:hypothetical protein
MQRWNRQVFAADKIDQVKRAMKKQVVELLPKVKWSTRGVDHVLINMGSYGTVQILKVTKRPNLL